MGLTLNGIILLVGITCGYYICYRFFPKEEQPIAVELIETREVCKATITKKTNKDGSVDEITEFLASRDEKEIAKPQSKIDLKNYGVGIYHDKTIMGEVRLGSMPLFLMGETNFKDYRIGIKFEF